MFLTLGFKNTTMDDLAQELGISKKTIYTHFRNKTKLVEATTEHLFKIISSGIDEICALEKDPIDEIYDIKKFAMIHLKEGRSSPHHQLRKYYPGIFNRLKKKQYDLMQTCVLRNIKKGVEQQIYRDNLNIDFVSRIYFSGVLSIQDRELFPMETFDIDALEHYYLEYHLRGIVTPKGRKKLNAIIHSNHE